MTGADADEIRDVLLEYSDHQAVRNLFGEHTGGGTATVADHVVAMRKTDGSVALIADDGDCKFYARWNTRRGRYEHLTVRPPWTVGDHDCTDRDGLISLLEEKDDIRPTVHAHTPFADQQVLSRLSLDFRS